MEKEPQYNFPVYHKGFYIVFEGVDGCGKSTQLFRLSNWLKAYKSVMPVETKEPDKSSVWGRKIYADLNDKNPDSMHAKDRFEFQRWYAMDLARDMAEITLPALENSKVVLKDRSHIVSCVYGSKHAQDVRDYIKKARMHLGKDFFWPDLILIFDVSPEIATERSKKKGRELDNFEKRIEFLAHVRQMYQLFADEYLNTFLMDASRSEEKIFEEVRQIVSAKIRQKFNPPPSGSL